MIENHVRKLYNQYVKKCSALEIDNIGVLDELQKGTYVTIDDLTWIKSHYEKLEQLYKSEKIGIYSE